MGGVLIVLALLLTSPAVGGQFADCPMLQESELGDSTMLTSSGLLAAALASRDEAEPSSEQPDLQYQLLEYNTVCLGQGTVRDTYRSASLVVRYMDSADVEYDVQLDLQCVNGTWSTVNFGGSEGAMSEASGNLTTPLRRDCLLCVSSSTANLSLAAGPPVSAEEHCLACTDDCVGLMRCYGTAGAAPLSQTCCNYFDMTGSCVTTCPANSSPNTQFECECDPGHSPDGSTCVEDSECDPSPCVPECDIQGCAVCLERALTVRCDICMDGFQLAEDFKCEPTTNHVPTIVGVVLATLLLLILMFVLFLVLLLLWQYHKYKSYVM